MTEEDKTGSPGAENALNSPALGADKESGGEKIENADCGKSESPVGTTVGASVVTKHGSAGTKTVEENDEPLWKRILRLLLDGGNAEKEAAADGIPISMVCDEINEMFYDEFCDIVIDFDGDKPFIISDYAEELRCKLT